MATTVTLKPNAIDISGSTSGTTTLQATAVAGTTTVTLPAATDTLVGRATTDTLTNKTLTAPVIASANITTALTLTGVSGTSGQVLTSGGSGTAPTWVTPSTGSGTVTSVATGTGLTGGPITSTGTIAIDSTVATLTGTQTLTNKTIQGGAITSGTAVATTSGTSIDFTSIPSWVKRITVMFNGVSTSGTSNVLIQLGSGSVSTSGYVATAVVSGASTGSLSSTSGYPVYTDQAAFVRSGLFIFCYMGSNIWAGSHVITASTTYISSGGGSNTLGGVLDRIRITSGNGTDTFDAGSINILYEG